MKSTFDRYPAITHLCSAPIIQLFRMSCKNKTVAKVAETESNYTPRLYLTMFPICHVLSHMLTHHIPT